MSHTVLVKVEGAQEAREESPNVQFPWKLHELLSKAEDNGHESIISWLPGGKAFKVHNKMDFTTKILPTLFNATKYKSFQR
jgi:HSF-type DNA-binding